MYILYFLLWVIYNGKFSLEIIIFGLVIAALILWFTCKFMDYSVKTELGLYRKIFAFLRYICLLIKEIIKANLGVIHLILTQKEEVQPMLVTFHSDVKTPFGKAMLANAITLTPGTITVTLEDSEYMVHCLDESLAEGINDSEAEKMIQKLEVSE